MNINELYINGLLAQAAYADGLDPDMTGTFLADVLLNELKDKGMTRAQADFIGANFIVVKQSSSTSAIEEGFSATVFQYIGEIGISTLA